MKNMKSLANYSRLKAESEMELQLEAEKPPITRNSFMSGFRLNPVELAWRSTCFFMFFTGALMMMTALRWAPSDKYCAAQLSVWCKSEYSFVCFPCLTFHCVYGSLLINLSAPLLEAVEYEERDFESGLSLESSGFTGPPTAEMEAKWESLAQGTIHHPTIATNHTYLLTFDATFCSSRCLDTI